MATDTLGVETTVPDARPHIGCVRAFYLSAAPDPDAYGATYSRRSRASADAVRAGSRGGSRSLHAQRWSATLASDPAGRL